MEGTVTENGSADDERGKLFVGGLSWDTTYNSLFQYFSQFGTVVDCVVMKNSQTGKSRGFGFVKFSDPSVLDYVLMHAPHWIDGRQVDPKICNPRSMNQGGKSTENSKRKIFVGGLPASCDQAQLKEFFRKYDSVEDATIMYDQERNRSRGFGFVTFESEEGVEKVCNEHYIFINGKQVECKRAEPRAIKSIADTGQAPSVGPMAIACAPGAMLISQPGAAGIAALAGGPQGLLSASPQTAMASPVAGALQHPGSPALIAPQFFAPTPVPFMPYQPAGYGSCLYYPEAMAQALPRQAAVGMQPAEGMSTLPTIQGNIQQQIAGVATPVNATGSRSVTTANGTDGSSAAQMSLNSTVTYAAAPTMTAPLPGTGPLFGHGDGISFIHHQIQPSNVGRIPTTHPPSRIGYHPYLR